MDAPQNQYVYLYHHPSLKRRKTTRLAPSCGEEEGERKGGREGRVIFLYNFIRVFVSCIFKQKVEGWCCHHKAKKRGIRVCHEH